MGFNCKCCQLDDIISKTYFDMPPFQPRCMGLCKPCFATEKDLTYCCYCINCVCYYNLCTKPCFGGVVVITPCPNDHGCFNCVTRCCICCNIPVARFLDDSEALKTALISKV